MTDPQQQNDRPQLTLEEELDVLEAVWKVGKEKGLDLLRPEQLKKLIDHGRISMTETGEVQETNKERTVAQKKRNAALMTDMFILMMKDSLEMILIEKMHYCPREEWEAKDQILKDSVLRLFFYLYYQAKEEDLRSQMHNKFAGGLI